MYISTRNYLIITSSFCTYFTAISNLISYKCKRALTSLVLYFDIVGKTMSKMCVTVIDIEAEFHTA